MRLHLFEFNDRPWLPTFLRDAMTGYLAAAYRMLPVSREWAKLIASALERQGSTRIIDLCSGAGGPLSVIEAELVAQGHAGVTITRTDLFPSNGVIYADARHVPQELKGVRTLFASFHHFRPDEAKAILRDARDSGQSICVFEVTRRGALPLILMLLTPLIVLFVTPRVRPRRWTQLLFTYPIPILPLLIAFDGLVSILRTYTVEELGAMTTDLNTVSYRFEPQDLKAPGLPFPLPVLLGRPTAG